MIPLHACAWLSLVTAMRVGEPVVAYTITLDTSDFRAYQVEMRIWNAPDTLWLAMMRHPEYDDRPWRNVRDLTVESDGLTAAIAREDSAVWRAVVRGRTAIVRYRVALPLPPPRGAPRRSWRPFLGANGGLVGGVQSFLYLVGHTASPAHVVLGGFPATWQIATGLEPTADPRVFYAMSIAQLLDAPILAGPLRMWRFAIDGVPHRVAYWPLPDAAAFDTVAFTHTVEGIARAAAAVFGAPPYREYTFLLQDGAGDALEHGNSVTLGAPSAVLARDPAALAPEIAHEFFHTWNLVRLHPAGWGGVTYRPPARVTGLWWSEGVTLYYADALLRRAGIRDETAARRALANTIASYLGNPGNTRIAPERASWTVNDPPSVNGGYTASYYSQGALIGQMLDVVIRDSSNLKRGLDDVIRTLFERLGESRGFTTGDVERTADAVCGCDLHAFFQAHVREARPPDVNRYLASLGLRAEIKREPATDSVGRPSPDTRVFAYVPEDGQRLRLVVSNPRTAWGRAGLRSGDEVTAIDSLPIATAQEFRATLRHANIGDRLVVTYVRDGRVARATVVLSGYETVRVDLEDLPSPSARQRAMRALWMGTTSS